MSYFSIYDVVTELTEDAMDLQAVDPHRYAAYLSAAVIINDYLQRDKDKKKESNQQATLLLSQGVDIL